MARISWSEVKDRAFAFSRRWATATKEEADKQTFWNEFFVCFGIQRRSVAVFEHAIRTAQGKYGFLDLFWSGTLLVEHKSGGGSLSKASSQAFRYLEEIASSGQHDQMPRYIVVCDFRNFLLFDLESHDEFTDSKLSELRFELKDFHKHVRQFSFMLGQTPVRVKPEDPANFKATQLLAELHDALQATGYRGPRLERYLVRLLFCLFAEDTGIFDEPGCFTSLVINSREDGQDLGAALEQLWQVLNTRETDRQTTLDEQFSPFPYVNGGLFAENLPTCAFNRSLRGALIDCTSFFWAKISPAVFGSLFQEVLTPKDRRQLGAHYTSERDILRVLSTSFLPELETELKASLADRSSRRRERLKAFQQRLRQIRIFDPACGCGNFLILAYRELRRLENRVLLEINTIAGKIQTTLNVRDMALVDVDQFYGIELTEWPVRIAEVGLWLVDHQCNVELAEALGQTFRRLPLTASPHLRIGNALRTDWRSVLPPNQNVHVIGNPPFVGAMVMTSEQHEDVEFVAAGMKGTGVLDYVSGWYIKAADYVHASNATCSFVSTSSITQGEQAGILWNQLFTKYGLKIFAAHRTFSWESEARGAAHVDVVIVAFAAHDTARKVIVEYTDDDTPPTMTYVANISPYLIEGPDRALENRRTPLYDVKPMMWGSQPRDGGHLLLSQSEMEELVRTEPLVTPYVRAYTGADEFINGHLRYCLWLRDAPPTVLRRPAIRSRLEQVKDMRSNSRAETTRRLAATPGLFAQIAHPDSDYLLVPLHSSELRSYIPIGFLTSRTVASNACAIVPGAGPYDFGVLSSSMHMAWVRTVCGRLESRYRYSKDIVYNNFPWPTMLTQQARERIEAAAKHVLTIRDSFPHSNLADLYDHLSMPAKLLKAHESLDRVVEQAYRKERFISDRSRVEFLFGLHEEKLASQPQPTPGRRREKRPRD